MVTLALKLNLDILFNMLQYYILLLDIFFKKKLIICRIT